MPLIQVDSSTSELLQDVADTLGKAKKVVVITGAGISTNSGIPDFRSQNGLYSLIQAQFEKAEASGAVRSDVEDASSDICDRPRKRRRLFKDDEDTIHAASSQESTTKKSQETASDSTQKEDLAVSDAALDERQPEKVDVEQSLPGSPEQTVAKTLLQRQITDSDKSSERDESIFSTAHASSASSQTSGSGVSTPAPDQPATPRKKPITELYSSSPLSSPPPVLFDPFSSPTQASESSSQSGLEYSDDSESEEIHFPPRLLSQASSSSLRSMKGRDLFDCNIWSDPLKTSVFYRFATTLRRKVRDVEPTKTHRFIARLRDVGKLTRVYTQNIDEIEKKIGLSTDLKCGAGNKRRKSTKPQQMVEHDRAGKEPSETVKDEKDGEGNEVEPSSQAGDETEKRSSSVPDKGVECVFLHGSLHSLRCFVCARVCEWDVGRESRTMLGEQPECPYCAGATAARQEKGKRALGVGKLRPDIVLYGEEHPQSDLISPIVQHDLSAGPDLLLVLGTSLRVHGLKVMVREFARSVHNKGGKVVFINFSKPSESTWGDVIDYWVQWDCDAWVDDLKERKPTLWMSPEAATEYDKQQREALAEKRREIQAEKKRETQAERKREREEAQAEKRKEREEALAEKKREKEEALAEKKRGKEEALAEKKRSKEEALAEKKKEREALAEKKKSESLSKKRKRESVMEQKVVDVPVAESPPKQTVGTKISPQRPQSDRNDEKCGAWCVFKISEAFAMLRGDPSYSLVDYQVPISSTTTTSAARSSTKKATVSKPMVAPKAPKVRKPRRSAPAAICAAHGPHTTPHSKLTMVEPKSDILPRPVIKAYTHGPGSLLDRPAVKACLYNPLASKNRFMRAAHELRSSSRSPAPMERLAELLHRPILPTPQPKAPPRTPPKTIGAAIKVNPRIRKPKMIDGEPVVLPHKASHPHHRRSTQSPAPAANDQENLVHNLPPLRFDRIEPPAVQLRTLEPAPTVAPPHSPLSPLASLSPNRQREPGVHYVFPMKVSDPLAGWKLSPHHHHAQIPNQALIRTPSDQLRDEAAAALCGLGRSN